MSEERVVKTKKLKQTILSLAAVMLVVTQTAFPVFGATDEKGQTSVVPKSNTNLSSSAHKVIYSGSGNEKGTGKILVAQNTPKPSAEGMNQITSLSADQEGSETSIKVKTAGDVNYTAFKLENPLRLVLDFPGTQPGEMKDVMEINQGIVGSIKSTYFEEAKVMRLEIGLNDKASYEIVKTNGTSLDVRVQGPMIQTKEEEVQIASLESQGGFDDSESASIYDTGKKTSRADSCHKVLSGAKEKYTFDFQDASLKNIFRIIADVSGLNMILHPDISGNANIRLVEVGWNTALELILDNYGLSRDCRNSIIRIAPKATIEAAQRAEPLTTEMIRISYADLKELVDNLNTMKSADRGKITQDTRTNTIILTDTKEKISEMISVIESLDVATPQVMIESKIVEISRNFLQDLGMTWSLNDNIKFNQPNFPSTGTSAFTIDLPISAAPTGAAVFSLLDSDHQLNVTLQAAETEGKSRTIANPKVTTLDNKEAQIKSGRRIPFQTTSANEGTKVDFVDADIRLIVTPHITADEDVFMKIQAAQNQADFGNAVLGVPSILTKEAMTQVLVDNGATAVLGGLFQKTTDESRDRVPYLHKIPILGYMFKNRFEQDVISELLIFVTPTIVRENVSRN